MNCPQCGGDETNLENVTGMIMCHFCHHWFEATRHLLEDALETKKNGRNTAARTIHSDT
jgi:hypothetical protein